MRDPRIFAAALALGSAGWGLACATGNPQTDGGSPTDAGVSDGGASDGGFVPAASPSLPPVPYGGGPLLSQVSIVTVTWDGDPLASQLGAFDLWLPASTYWRNALGEYGIGPGMQVGQLGLDGGGPATISDAEIQVLLRSAVDGGQLPPPSPDLVASVYPPPGTRVTLRYQGTVYQGCNDFTGYHSILPLLSNGGDGGFLVYTVVPRCPTPGFSDLDATSWASSHETAEAATDPFNVSGIALPGWALPVGAGNPNGGELGDLCLNNPREIEGNLVTALYSNRAADAGARPCVPAPAGPMFGAVASSSTLGIPVGSSKQVSLLVYSSAPLPSPLTLKLIPYDLSALSVFASSAMAENGDNVTVTVMLNGGAVPGSTFTLEVLLTSSDGYRVSTFVAIQAE